MASEHRDHFTVRLWAAYGVIGLLYLAVLIWAANWHGPHHFQPPYWTTWQDQSEYLRSAQALAALRLDAADHWYPLLYPLIAAPFTILTPALPFALIDGLCVLAAFAGFRRVADSFGVSLWPALFLFILTTLIEPHVARNWVEPWTTTVSAALIWLALGEVIPMLMVAVIWYLIITSILNVVQGFIERYYARGERGAGQADKPAVRVEEPA